MISPAELGRLLTDYGPTVAFVVILVIFLVTLVLLWKPVSKFMTAINNIIALPARLDVQDKLTKEKYDSIEEVRKDLKTHVSESAIYVEEMRGLKREVGAIAMSQADIIHEVKPNSGSSMKDALDRIEQEVLPALAKQVESLAAAAVKQSGRVNQRAEDQDAAAAEAAASPRPTRSRRKSVDSTEQP